MSKALSLKTYHFKPIIFKVHFELIGITHHVFARLSPLSNLPREGTSFPLSSFEKIYRGIQLSYLNDMLYALMGTLYTLTVNYVPKSFLLWIMYKHGNVLGLE